MVCNIDRHALAPRRRGSGSHVGMFSYRSLLGWCSSWFNCKCGLVALLWRTMALPFVRPSVHDAHTRLSACNVVRCAQKAAQFCKGTRASRHRRTPHGEVACVSCPSSLAMVDAIGIHPCASTDGRRHTLRREGPLQRP